MTGVALWLNASPGRGAAFAIHALLSLIVFSSLVVVMLLFWFPGDLFFMDGGWEGLKLVAMIDLVLGPLLTLILFKPGKPGLKFDLSIIAALQLVALAYGFYTTYHQRTVAVVFAENEFATVSAKDNREADRELVELDITPGQLPEPKMWTIPLLLTPPAENFGDYLAGIMNGYPVAHQRSDQYVSIVDNHDYMQHARLSREDLEATGALAGIKHAASEKNKAFDDIEVYRFRARYAKGYALYDPQSARIIDFVKRDPRAATSTASADDS